MTWNFTQYPQSVEACWFWVQKVKGHGHMQGLPCSLRIFGLSPNPRWRAFTCADTWFDHRGRPERRENVKWYFRIQRLARRSVMSSRATLPFVSAWICIVRCRECWRHDEQFFSYGYSLAYSNISTLISDQSTISLNQAVAGLPLWSNLSPCCWWVSALLTKLNYIRWCDLTWLSIFIVFKQTAAPLLLNCERLPCCFALMHAITIEGRSATGFIFHSFIHIRSALITNHDHRRITIVHKMNKTKLINVKS